MSLTPSQAKKVLRAHVTNTVKKVLAGKSVTPTELQLIERCAEENAPKPSDPNWISSYEKLGTRFGLHRASFPRIIRDHKEDPLLPKARANGDHSAEAWETFFEAHPEIRRAQTREGPINPTADVGPTRSALQDEKLIQQIRAIRINNNVKDGIYVEKAAVLAMLITAATDQKGILRGQLEGALPVTLSRLGTPEAIRTELARVVDNMCGIMSRLLEQITAIAAPAGSTPETTPAPVPDKPE